MAEAEPPTTKHERTTDGNKPTSFTTERRPSRKRTITTLYETDSYVAVDTVSYTHLTLPTKA